MNVFLTAVLQCIKPKPKEGCVDDKKWSFSISLIPLIELIKKWRKK